MAQQRIMSDWRIFSVGPDATLRETMMTIDHGKLGLALVVDEDCRLLGTVTDGDLRRAILRGAVLNDAITDVMNPHFTTVEQDVIIAQVLELMRARSIRHVPALSSSGAVVGVYHLPDLIDAFERPNWAVIMAGGEGRRLRPLTATVPKPMLPVGGRPLLDNLVGLLVQHGVRELFISVNYLAEQIESYFGDGKQFNCRITYLRESQPLGTAGALSLLPATPRHPLLVLNGDLLTDLNISALMDYHLEADCAATQCIREYTYQIPFGVVRCEADQVVELEEKPLRSQFINAGIYVLSPELLDLVPQSESFTMPDLLVCARRLGHHVAAFPIGERWADIGQPEDYDWAWQHWLPTLDE